MRFFHSSLYCLPLVLFTGCVKVYGDEGIIKNADHEYHASNNTPPLRIPHNVNAEVVGDEYPIPKGPEDVTYLEGEALLPPASLAQKIRDKQVTRDTIKRNEQWLEKQAKIQEANEAAAAEAENTAYEKELDETPVIAVIPDPSIPNSVGSAWTHSGETLLIAKPLNLTWNLVNNALPKATYMILLKNPLTHIYYILDKSETKGRITGSTPIYQVHLKAIEKTGTQIQLTNNDGLPVPKDISTTILSNLAQALAGKKVEPPSPFQQFLKDFL